MKRIIEFFITILIAFPLLQFEGGLAFAKTYYISSSSGNDANNGTSIATPWKTVGKVSQFRDFPDRYRAGDSILFKRGDSFEGQIHWAMIGTADSMCVVGAYGTGAKPIILGDMSGRTWEAVPGRPGYYRTATDFNIHLLSAYAYRNGQWAKMSWTQLGNSVTDRETWLNGIGENTFSLTSNKDSLYVHTYGNAIFNPDSFRATRMANFIGGTYVIVRDLELRYFHHGIYTSDGGNYDSLAHSIFRNLSIYSSIGIGIYIHGENSNNNIVDSCRIDSTGWTAIYVYLGSRNTYRYNHVSNVGLWVRGMYIGGTELCGCGDQGSPSNYFTQSTGNVFEYNLFEDISSCGFDSYWNTADTIRYNTFRRMSVGVTTYGRRMVVLGNIFEDITSNASSLNNLDVGETLFKNNIISSLGWGIKVDTFSLGTYLITNNTVNLTSGNDNAIFANYLAPGITTSTNNKFYGRGRWRAGTTNANAILYLNLSNFQSATGYEAGSTWSSSPSAPTGTLITSDSLLSIGGSITLKWTSLNATSASISYKRGAVDTVFNVGLNDSMAVTITATTTFTLTLIGPFGTTTMSVRVIVGMIPLEYSLEQNYPNPFNTSTTIGFVLPKGENVSLKVYDILGREIATIIEGMRTSGVHQIQWKILNIASGVYRYRLTAGSYSKTLRMVIVR